MNRLLEDLRHGLRVLLTHVLWQRRFGSNPTVINQSIMLDGKSHHIIGVLPPGFQFPEPFELWRPLALSESVADLPEGAVSLRLLRVLGRREPDATLARAQAEFEVIHGRLMRSGASPSRRTAAVPAAAATEHSTRSELPSVSRRPRAAAPGDGRPPLAQATGNLEMHGMPSSPGPGAGPIQWPFPTNGRPVQVPSPSAIPAPEGVTGMDPFESLVLPPGAVGADRPNAGAAG